jgi:hypothetical protein
MRQSPLNEAAGLVNSASTLAADVPIEEEETEIFKIARQVFTSEALAR